MPEPLLSGSASVGGGGVTVSAVGTLDTASLSVSGVADYTPGFQNVTGTGALLHSSISVIGTANALIVRYALGSLAMDEVGLSGSAVANALPVYPIVPGGIFEGTESIITNQSATWIVLSQNPLDGAFTFYSGGAWVYTRGTQTGTASFTYEVRDYDGQGSNTTATHSVIVQ